MSFTIAGPDSMVQRRARIHMMDQLTERARLDGTVSAEDREAARLEALAMSVVGWDVAEGGKPLAFEHRNIVRVLRAATWLEAQVDAFAGDRANFKPALLEANA